MPSFRAWEFCNENLTKMKTNTANYSNYINYSNINTFKHPRIFSLLRSWSQPERKLTQIDKIKKNSGRQKKPVSPQWAREF